MLCCVVEYVCAFDMGSFCYIFNSSSAAFFAPKKRPISRFPALIRDQQHLRRRKQFDPEPDYIMRISLDPFGGDGKVKIELPVESM